MKLIIVFGILLVLILTFLGGYACRAQQSSTPTVEELQAALKLQEAAQEWDALQLKKIPEAVKSQESALKQQMEQRAKNIAEIREQLKQAQGSAPKAAVKK